MKILIIKLNHIGDTLLITASLKAIKKSYPHCLIDVVVRKGCEGILLNNPDINNIVAIAAPERKNRNFLLSCKEIFHIFKKLFFKRYDYSFDLTNSDRARIINILSFSKRKVVNSWHTNIKKTFKRFFYTDFIEYAWGDKHQVLKDYNTIKSILELEDNVPNLCINTDFHTNILDTLKLKKNSYIVIHPTTRWKFKQWDIEKWKEITSYINILGLKVLFTCGPDKDEVEYIKNILVDDKKNTSTLGQTSLIELAKLIENAQLFIGVDTAASHISAAVGTPSVILFGPTDEWSWHPWKVEHKLILGNCTCKINRKITCDKTKILPCMNSISIEDVKININNLL